MKIELANINDLPEILYMQKSAFKSEADIYNNYSIQPLMQTLEEVEKEFNNGIFLKAAMDNKIVGSVRSNIDDNICYINKLIVHPEFQNQGLGAQLMRKIEIINMKAKKYLLATGYKSEKNIYLYKKLGYNITCEKVFHDGVKAVFMEKINNYDNT